MVALRGQPDWRAEFEAGARERAVNRAVAPLMPVLVAARRVARLPTWSVKGEVYRERKAAVAQLQAAIRAHDEAT